MFRELISRPIDPIPVEYTNSLSRLNGEPDYSLTCLGIAMLKHRIENYNGITGVYKHFNDEITCVSEAIDYLDHSYDGRPTFCYYMYSRTDDENDIAEMLKDKGFIIKEPIGALIKQKADVKCIAAYQENKDFGVVFINSRDNRYYHLIISFLSLFLPNLFKDKEMAEQDFNLVKALSKNDKNAFVRQIQECVTPYITEFRRIMLATLIKSMHEIKVIKAKDDMDGCRRYIEDLEAQLAGHVSRLKDAIVLYEGLKATEYVDQPEEELVDYLSTNKLIHNLHMEGTMLSFTVATLLNNYDEDTWATFAERGYIYDGHYSATLLEVFGVEKNRKLLLDSIFGYNPEFTIKTCANYFLDLHTNRLTCNSNYDYINADPIYEDYLVNPHVGLFACLGGYKERVRQELDRRNFVGAIELCCASAGSVNLSETEQTFRPFIGWLLSSRKKVLRRKDGVEMTPEEAVVYLAEKEKDE